MFSVAAAVLSAFLDALTVTAVLKTVFVALYGVDEKVHSLIGIDYNENEKIDRKEMGGDSLENFRAFLRSLVMHRAVGTALGGVATLVGVPQNLLIGEKMGWDFIAFAAEVAHISFPAFIVGLCVVVAVVEWVLALPIEQQLKAFFLANGIHSAISDNVFVATVYINEVRAAFDAGKFSREHLDALAVAINTETNLPSVATPNGQAAFLFLLT